MRTFDADIWNFGKPDFVYLAKDDAYRCPAGEKLAHHFTADENGQKMRIYLTKACRTCRLKDQRTTSNERRIKRWEHEHVVEAVQTRLDQNPQAMRVRRQTVEHPFATLKMRMGATHFLMKTLPKVATEMALHVLAYNLTRVINIVGFKPFLAAIGVRRASRQPPQRCREVQGPAENTLKSPRWCQSRLVGSGLGMRSRIFTQPGSKSEVAGLARHVRSTLNSRHRQAGPARPKSANKRLMHRSKHYQRQGCAFHRTPTGSPEAVACLRFPQNVACGFTALRSSAVGSQHC